MRPAGQTQKEAANLSATMKPFLDMFAREDLVIVDLVATADHGMQGLLGVLAQHIPPQHKLHLAQS